MRQFVLGKGLATSATGNGTGQTGLFYINSDGNYVAMPSANATATDATKALREAYLISQTPDSVQNVVIPLHTNRFKYVKSTYQKFGNSEGVTFPDELQNVEVEVSGAYTMIVALKGKTFNERNKYTASVYVSDEEIGSVTIAQIVSKFVDQLNMSHSVGVKMNNGKFEITDPTVKGFVIKFTDNLAGIPDVEYFSTEQNDAAYVSDLAQKAAADAGVEYTYKEANQDMYPTYPLNPLATSLATDNGFVVFTLTFAEPRNSKTTDEAIKQVVQVAFPVGDSALTGFENQLKVFGIR